MKITNRKSQIKNLCQPNMELDILSLAAHPDDTELTCGGTVIKMVEAGYKVGVLDLTAGESGTRGNPRLREREARRATRVMGLVYRENLGLPDAALEDRREYKLQIAQKIRELRPRTVILPYWEGRHPDHYVTGQIGYEACSSPGSPGCRSRAARTGPTRLSMPRNTFLPCGPASSWTSRRSLKRS